MIECGISFQSAELLENLSEFFIRALAFAMPLLSVFSVKIIFVLLQLSLLFIRMQEYFFDNY
jgi:hypothetical protein